MEKDFFTKNQETFTSNQMAAKCSKACHRPFRFNDVVFFAPQPHKFTALHMAVEQDKNGIIQLLLSQKDVDVNACDEVSL